jgi:hypothetical protein
MDRTSDGYEFLYGIKAGPAGGRLRRPSSRRQRHTGNWDAASLSPEHLGHGATSRRLRPICGNMPFMNWGTIVANAIAGAALLVSLVVAIRRYRARKQMGRSADIEIDFTPDSLIVVNSGSHDARDIRIDIVSATDLPAPRIEGFPDSSIQIAYLAPNHVEEYPAWITGASHLVNARLRWIDRNGHQDRNVQAFIVNA